MSTSPEATMSEASPKPFAVEATDQFADLSSRVPTYEDLERAQATVDALQQRGNGYSGPDGKFVKRSVVEGLQAIANPETWMLDADTAGQLQGVLDAAESGELPKGMKRDFNLPLGEQVNLIVREASDKLTLDGVIREARKQELAADTAKLKESYDSRGAKRATLQKARERLNTSREQAELSATEKAAYDEALKAEQPALERAKAGLTGDSLERHHKGKQLELEARQRVRIAAGEVLESRRQQIAEAGGGQKGVAELKATEEKAAWRERMGIGEVAEKAGHTVQKPESEYSFRSDPTAWGMNYTDWLEAGGASGAEARNKNRDHDEDSILSYLSDEPRAWDLPDDLDEPSATRHGISPDDFDRARRASGAEGDSDDWSVAAGEPSIARPARSGSATWTPPIVTTAHAGTSTIGERMGSFQASREAREKRTRRTVVGTVLGVIALTGLTLGIGNHMRHQDSDSRLGGGEKTEQTTTVGDASRDSTVIKTTPTISKSFARGITKLEKAHPELKTGTSAFDKAVQRALDFAAKLKNAKG